MAKKKPPDLADELRRAIKMSGLSLNQLAKETGVHQAQLSRFVRGKRTITVSAAAKVCSYLGLRLTGADPDKNE
jgi:transcriptional regulator with XRE-family HTH domain